MALDEVAAGDFIFDDYMNYIVRRQVNRPVCRLTLTSNVTLNSTGSNIGIVFGSGTEVLDDRGWHSISTNTSRVTPDLAGRYLVQANATFAGAATTTVDRRVMVLKNSGLTACWFRNSSPLTASQSMSVAISDVIEMNGTTDFFQMAAFTQVVQDLAGTGDSVGSTCFTVTFLGDSL